MHLTLRRGRAQLPHIRTPFFVSNSQFDSWSMGSILGAQAYISLCPADQKSYGTCSTNCKFQRLSVHSCFRATRHMRRSADFSCAADSACQPQWKDAVDGWATAFRAKLAPALNMPQHGIFVSWSDDTQRPFFGPAFCITLVHKRRRG